MLIRFSGPFEKLAGQEIHLTLPEPVTLRTLIARLSGRCDGFRAYAQKQTDVDLYAHIAFIRKGRALKLDEAVTDEEELDVLLPATGG